MVGSVCENVLSHLLPQSVQFSLQSLVLSEREQENDPHTASLFLILSHLP